MLRPTRNLNLGINLTLLDPRYDRFTQSAFGYLSGTRRSGIQAVTLTLEDEIDVSRGDVLAAADSPPAVADQFETTIIWMADEPMLPGRPYWMKIGTQLVGAEAEL